MTLIPRRRFLASTSVAATPLLGLNRAEAAASKPQSSAKLAGSTRQNAWQLLAVAPRSRKVQSLESDYRNGVELGLAQHAGLNVQLHWIGADAVPSKAARTIEAELDRLPQLHGVMGWFPPELERRVAVMTEARGLPLWVSDIGADRRESSLFANRPAATAYHSLELCAHAQQLAQHVMKHQGSRAVLAVGWMESGYDFVVAFQDAYRALGGRIVGRHIGGPKPHAQEFDGLRGEIFGQRPDSVVAFYSGPQAERFAQWWQSNAQGQGSWTLAPDLLTHVVGNASELAPWREPFATARLPWTPSAWLGAQAGAGIGQSLRDMDASGTSVAALDRAWSQTKNAGSFDSLQKSAQTHDFRSATRMTSGWLSGYLQT